MAELKEHKKIVVADRDDKEGYEKAKRAHIEMKNQIKGVKDQATEVKREIREAAKNYGDVVDKAAENVLNELIEIRDHLHEQREVVEAPKRAEKEAADLKTKKEIEERERHLAERERLLAEREAAAGIQPTYTATFPEPGSAGLPQDTPAPPRISETPQPKVLILDAEIEKCIPPRNKPKDPNLQYCEGWGDKEGMGITVVCAWSFPRDIPMVFLKDNFDELQHQIYNHDIIVGFNNIPFDNALLRANGFTISDGDSYDILREFWAAAGLGPKFVPQTHGGYGLEAIASSNFIGGKSGSGELAPVLWQRGQYGQVIDYCMRDVWLTKRIWEMIIAGQPLNDPKADKLTRVLRRPEQFLA